MIASFSNSRESRTKVTLDHRVSLPETEARTCSVSSASVKKLPVRKASSTEPSQECPLIPFTGANGFKILTLHPESGELHPWSLHPGKYYSEKLEKKKLSSQISGEGVDADLHSMFQIKIADFGYRKKHLHNPIKSTVFTDRKFRLRWENSTEN